MGVSCSRQPREALEVRRPFFQKGALALASLVGAVEEERRVARQFLQAGLSVAIGVERRLQAAQRGRRVREDLAAPGDRLLLEARARDDRVDEAPGERGRRVVLAAEEPDFARALL